MHKLDAVFMHISDADIFMRILHAVFMQVLDADIFMHKLNAALIIYQSMPT